MPPVKSPKPKINVGDLTPAERAELLRQLRAGQDTADREGLEERDLTAHEKAVRGLLRERDHLEGCPVIEDEARAVGRVEAYQEVQPPSPARGRLTPRPVTVARCIECGGSRVIAGTVSEVLIASIAGPVAGAPDTPTELDDELT